MTEPVAWLDERSGLIYHKTTHPERYTPLYKKWEWVGLTTKMLADALEEKPDSDGHCRQAAAELRRLDEVNAQLLEALVDIAYQLEKARIWGGMEWKYNPLHPMHYLPARDKARAAIAVAKGEA